MAEREDEVSRTVRGLRFDLVIAVCALLISTLATGASWWQARVLQAQTRVLQEQLGAQVWPYVSVTEDTYKDSAQISIANDGLGPGVVRSGVVLVSGVPTSSFVDLLHAILGPHIIARAPHGSKMSISANSVAPGSVLRPGESTTILGITSKTYVKKFVAAFQRMDFRICYCAIIPGKCWLSDSASSRDPQPMPACREVPNDLLHASAIDVLQSRSY
jgi:hypothetical protein